MIKQTKLKQTPIDKIPEDWEVVRLGDILSLEYGKGLPERERIPGKYPVVGSNGVIGYHKQALVKGPGIVVGRKGTIGAVNWIDSDFWPIDTTFYAIISADNSSRFLHYLLSTVKWESYNEASGVPSLSANTVHDIEIYLPSFHEQIAIAGYGGCSIHRPAPRAKATGDHHLVQNLDGSILREHMRLPPSHGSEGERQMSAPLEQIV